MTPAALAVSARPLSQGSTSGFLPHALHGAATPEAWRRRCSRAAHAGTVGGHAHAVAQAPKRLGAHAVLVGRLVRPGALVPLCEAQEFVDAGEGHAIGERPGRPDGQQPVGPPGAEDLGQVRPSAALVERVAHVLVEVLDGGGVAGRQRQVHGKHVGEEEEGRQGDGAEQQQGGPVGGPKPARVPGGGGRTRAQEGEQAAGQLRQHARQRDEASKCSVCAQEQEELMVVEADAIVDPRAVVVHAENTSAAHAAVVGPVRPRPAALLAERGLPGLPLRACRHDGQRLADAAYKLVPPPWHHSRVTSVRLQVAPQRKAPEGVEDYEKWDDQCTFACCWEDAAQEHEVVGESLVGKSHESSAHHGR
eukprot:CAMPEP_0179108056 /NCGR_PEP_ID=MMETSP0796-20121207/50315_1 /TAXON_ID=73915 /ORGANISM="Pyrodinium bahamense, Strain pbaha01" /LENGTH=362 /DNA_ID=CAMNT_0020806119 /DNA_START=168 /DNA_END=1257 /DNA_ORIENTATION=-